MMDSLTNEDLFEISVAVNFTRLYWADISLNHPEEATRIYAKVKASALLAIEKKLQAVIVAMNITHKQRN